MSDSVESAGAVDQVSGLDAASWMLGLSVSQIGNALQEGDNSIDTLTGSITELMDAVRMIDENTAISFEIIGLPADSPLHKFDGKIIDYVQNVVMALQFYDRLSQRLKHVADGLSGLAELTGSPERLQQAEEWQRFLDGVCALHSTREEQQLFDKHVAKAPLNYLPRSTQEADDDDIELF